MGLGEDEIKSVEQIYIVACGSAWHVGVEAVDKPRNLAKSVTVE